MLACFVAKLLCKQKFNSHLYQQLKAKNKIERREYIREIKALRNIRGRLVCMHIYVCTYVCICIFINIGMAVERIKAKQRIVLTLKSNDQEIWPHQVFHLKLCVATASLTGNIYEKLYLIVR